MPLRRRRREGGGQFRRIQLGGAHVCEDRGRLRTVGNELVTIEPETHDQAMRTVQGAAHAAIFAYGLAAEPVPPELHTPVSATLEQLLERVTHGYPGVYREIQDSFDGTEALAAAARRMAADPSAFEALYDPLDTGG